MIRDKGGLDGCSTNPHHPSGHEYTPGEVINVCRTICSIHNFQCGLKEAGEGEGEGRDVDVRGGGGARRARAHPRDL